jgi:hypothetical protein
VDAAIRTGWIELLKYQGYIDDHNAIIWSAEPKSQLSEWMYRKLLDIIGTSDPDDAAATFASTSAHLRVASAIPTAEHGRIGGVVGISSTGGAASSNNGGPAIVSANVHRHKCLQSGSGTSQSSDWHLRREWQPSATAGMDSGDQQGLATRIAL